MSPGRPRATAAELLRVLDRAGWYEHRQSSGSHLHLRHPDKSGRRVTVPRHAGITLHPKLVATILDQADLTADELRALL